MKIKMTADSKRIVSLEEAPVAQSIISSMKEDDTSTPADYIKQAVNALCGGRNSCEQVFEPRMQTIHRRFAASARLHVLSNPPMPNLKKLCVNRAVPY